MTRASLADAAYLQSSLSRRAVGELTGQMFEAIEAALVNEGAAVKILQFGSFVPFETPARMGLDPKHPERHYPIPAHTRIAFRASPELRRRVDRQQTLTYAKLAAE